MSLAVFTVALLVSAADKPRACVVDLADASNHLAVAPTLAVLETSLRAHFTVVSNKRVIKAARALRLQRSRWLEPDSITRLSGALGCESALGLRAVSTFGTWTVYLTELEGKTGALKKEVHVVLPRPRLTDDRARDLVSALVEGRGSAAPPPPTLKPPEPVAPPPPRPDDDVWEKAEEGFAAVSDAPAPTESAVEALAAQTRVEVGGLLAIEHYGYFANPDESKLSGRDDLDAAIHLKAVHPRATAYVSVLARADFADPSRNRFEPDEAWLEVNLPQVTLKAGRLLASWGAASLYNPTDVLNPLDLRDPLDPEKWGTLMLKAAVTLGPATLEAYYLPVPETHRLPVITGIDSNGVLQSRSRWVRGAIDVGVSAPLTFAVGPMQPPPPRPSNTQAAVRLLLSVGGADLSLGYALLNDRFPSPALEAVPDPGVPLNTTVYVDWLYRRLHVLTFDAERTFGKLRVAGEVAAFLTRDLDATNRNVADPYLILNLGGDYQTGAFLGDQRLHFFLEFVHARALVGTLPDSGLDLFRTPFRLALLGRVAWELTDDLHVELKGSTSLERFDVLLSPRLAYSFFDRVKAQAGVDLLVGDRSRGFFGPWHDNTRFTLVLESRF